MATIIATINKTDKSLHIQKNPDYSCCEVNQFPRDDLPAARQKRQTSRARTVPTPNLCQRAATVLSELIDAMDISRIEQVFPYTSTATLQRLGYLLDFVLEEKDKADELYGLLKAACSNMKKVLLSNSARESVPVHFWRAAMRPEKALEAPYFLGHLGHSQPLVTRQCRLLRNKWLRPATHYATGALSA